MTSVVSGFAAIQYDLRRLSFSALLLAVVPALRPDTAAAPVSFEDISAASGIATTLRNSPTPEKHQIETMPGGVAAFDFDRDGLVDLFLTNGARPPALDKPDPSWWNRLYRNRGNRQIQDGPRQTRRRRPRVR